MRGEILIHGIIKVPILAQELRILDELMTGFINCNHILLQEKIIYDEIDLVCRLRPYEPRLLDRI